MNTIDYKIGGMKTMIKEIFYHTVLDYKKLKYVSNIHYLSKVWTSIYMQLCSKQKINNQNTILDC